MLLKRQQRQKMVRKISDKEIKEHPDEGVKAIADDLDKVSAISALGQTQGGRILVEGLVSDIIDCMDALASHYKKYSHQEFIGVCADMKNKLDLVRSITRAEDGKKALEEMLDEAIKK